MSENNIGKIFTYTSGLYVVIEFVDHSITAIGEIQRQGEAHRWEQELQNIDAKMDIIDRTTPACSSHTELSQKGQIITTISKGDDEKYYLRIDGKIKEISAAELKALLTA